MIERLPKFDDSIGDDSPWATLRYGRVPEGFGFSALPLPGADCPLTKAAWPDLIRYADRHYRNWEIVGETLTDFQMNLEDAYEAGADTFERLLEVYHEDIAKPILGRTEKTTYNLTDTDTGSDGSTVKTTGSLDSNATTARNTLGKSVTEGSETTAETTESHLTGKHMTDTEGMDQTANVPLDNPTLDKPNTRSKANGKVTEDIKDDSNGKTDTAVTTNVSVNDTGEVSGTDTRKDATVEDVVSTGTSEGTHTQTGDVTIELSDLGVRPNYESLNGFLDNNRTAKQVFVGLFKDCFTLLEYQTF